MITLYSKVSHNLRSHMLISLFLLIHLLFMKFLFFKKLLRSFHLKLCQPYFSNFRLGCHLCLFFPFICSSRVIYCQLYVWWRPKGIDTLISRIETMLSCSRAHICHVTRFSIAKKMLFFLTKRKKYCWVHSFLVPDICLSFLHVRPSDNR